MIYGGVGSWLSISLKRFEARLKHDYSHGSFVRSFFEAFNKVGVDDFVELGDILTLLSSGTFILTLD